MSSLQSKDEEWLHTIAAIQQAASAVALEPSKKKRRKIDHRSLPREEKRDFQHERALNCIMYDYLGPQPLFDGREFESMFRVSRGRFQCLMEDIKKADIPFHFGNTDAFGHRGASFEARILLPLKSMAHGVPPHCFRDYFSMSGTHAKTCCNKFHDTIQSSLMLEVPLLLPGKTPVINGLPLLPGGFHGHHRCCLLNGCYCVQAFFIFGLQATHAALLL